MPTGGEKLKMAVVHGLKFQTLKNWRQKLIGGIYAKEVKIKDTGQLRADSKTIVLFQC